MLSDLKAPSIAVSCAAPRQHSVVRIQAAALDESEISGGSVVLRGRVASASLHRLLVDREYQRALGDRPDLDEAIRAGNVLPDVVLGCRGFDYDEDGADFLLKEPTFIIDGWQRIGTARKILDQIPHLEIRIGCLVHFGTDQKFEREQFTKLNRGQKKVKSNHHLRNLRQESPGLLTLYGLSHNERGFPLRGRVCWEQNMARHHLITAMHLMKAAQYLHSHHVGISGMNCEELAKSVDLIAQKVGLQTLRHNMSTFFSIVDEAWGVSNIEYRSSAPHMKGQFLNVLARLFSRHPVFWANDDKILKLDASTRSKLQSFQIRDPQVVQLAGSSGASKEILYQVLLNHINSGRREHRLVERAE
jgi:hypothetical protein